MPFYRHAAIRAAARLPTIFFLLLPVILLSAISNVVSADPATHAGPIEHAVNLQFAYDEQATLVTISNAWSGAPDHVYRLESRGRLESRAPSPGDSRSDAVTLHIPTPLRRVISLATPNIPFLRDLEVLDTLVGVDTAAYVYDETVRRRLATGEIRAVGTGSSLDVERVIALRPDLVLASSMGPDDATVTRLRGAGIPVMVIADWRETTPLGRAEWIRLFGALYEREARAAELFRQRADRYVAIRDRVDRQIPRDRRPTVMTNGPWQGQWPVPAGDSYVAQLLKDAGADYLWADTDGTGSIFLDLEVVLARALNADFWINLNYDWSSRADVRRADPRLTSFSAYRNNRMFHHIKRVRPADESGASANDFWETGVGRPDIVLADLVSILHGGAAGGDGTHDTVFYRRIAP